ncbi:hypothetical protein FB451DRAFT_1413585 [Mycena latifolia]|nr:hypothetical protein FB451DRAFT_1413585 [Mycena latifolia]
MPFIFKFQILLTAWCIGASESSLSSDLKFHFLSPHAANSWGLMQSYPPQCVSNFLLSVTLALGWRVPSLFLDPSSFKKFTLMGLASTSSSSFSGCIILVASDQPLRCISDGTGNFHLIISRKQQPVRINLSSVLLHEYSHYSQK